MKAYKRRRRADGQLVTIASPARPIDKKIITVYQPTLAGTQIETTLYTATFPATITGLRWSMTASQGAGSALCLGKWAVVVVRDGLSASTLIVAGSGSDLYTPEQDVLAQGNWGIYNNVGVVQFEDKCKTSRNLKGGDALILCMRGVSTNTTALTGNIQFFVKG